MSHILCDYDSQTRCEPRRGVVVGFSRLAEPALQSMKEDLGLSMTVSELRFCQKAYRTPEQGSPTLDEIYFLDAVANGLHHSRDFVSVSRLRLSHSEAARTYRDLLEKRTLLSGRPRVDAPSMCELSSLLAQVLARSGKEIAPLGAFAVADRFEALEAAAEGLSLEETLSVDPILPSLQLFSGDQSRRLNTKRAKEDDVILLLRCPIEDSLYAAQEPFHSSFLLRLSLLAQSRIYQETVHACRAIDERGIAIALLALYDGIYAELAEIPSVFDDGELYDLALCERGSLLVAVPCNTADRLLEEAERYGILGACIARAVKGNRLTVRKNGHAPYSLSAPFLRAFSEHRVPFLLEGTKVPQDTPEVMHRVIRNADAVDLSLRGRTPLPSVSSSSGLCSAAGSRTLSFECGVNTALLSVFEAVLSGAELSRLSVTDAYVYPEKLTSSSLGGLFESFLGVYRVLAELALPNRSTFLPFSGRSDYRSEGMAVYCFDKAPRVRSEQFSVRGSEVYLVALPKNGDIYDFSLVRSLLSKLSELRRNGLILSASLGMNRAPSEVIKAMSSSSEIAYDASVSEKSLDERLNGIFIVLETSLEIAGLRHIGRVQRVMLHQAETALPVAGSLSGASVVSRRRISVPSVVLLPSHDSGSLCALKGLFESSGCAVRILPDPTKDTEVLESAQIVVLSGRTAEGVLRTLSHINGDPRTAYLLRSLTERDGILLAPRSTRTGFLELLGSDTSIREIDSFSGAGVYLHDGLDEEAVQPMLNFYR